MYGKIRREGNGEGDAKVTSIEHGKDEYRRKYVLIIMRVSITGGKLKKWIILHI